MTRMSFDDIFIEMVSTIERLSTCDRGRCAALIVKDKRPISMGYVGSLPGFEHCDDVGHEFKKMIKDGIESKHCIRNIHAESNAIYFCAKNGISTEGATMYCTMQPCRKCTEAIIMCGIKKIICKYLYHGPELEEVLEMLKKSNIDFIVRENKSPNYIEEKNGS